MRLQKIRLAQIHPSDSEMYNHFGQQVDGMNTPKVAIYIATGGETEIDVATLFGNGAKTYWNIGTKQLQVYINGTFQQEGPSRAYTENTGDDAGKKITFNEALVEGDQLVLRIEGVGSGYMNIQQHIHVWREVPTPLPDGTNNEFFLEYIPHEKSEVVFLDGIAMKPGLGNDYLIEANKVTFIRTDLQGNPAPPSDESNIQINYVR